MPINRCPYLGLQEDPGTALDFPSPGNFCQRAAPTGPVKIDYQQTTCLTGNHVLCPIFAASQTRLAPPGIITPQPQKPRLLKIAALISLPLAIFAVIGLGSALNINAAWLAAMNLVQSGKSNDVNQASGFSLFPAPQGSTSQPIATAVSPSPEPTPNCPMPENWVPYTVNPTDSLYRLSVIYGLTIEELQRVNCLGNETVLAPGQVIYIPFSPTDTPWPTSTLSHIYPTWTLTPPPLVVYPFSTTAPSEAQPITIPATDIPTNIPATNPPPTSEPIKPPEVKPTKIPKPTVEPKPTKETKPTKEPKPTKPSKKH